MIRPLKKPSFFKHALLKRWGLYFCKATILLGVLFLFGKSVPFMPPIGVALIWVTLSLVSALGLVYHVVVKKTHKQFMLQKSGMLSKLNGGRIFSLVVAFVFSAICMAGLILEIPKWSEAEWVLMAAAIPLYLIVSLVINKCLRKEYNLLFCVSKSVLVSSVIVGVLLCVAYAAIIFLTPAATYANTAEAFLSSKQPFAESPTALLSEAGKFTALVDGLTAYSLAKMAEASFVGYIIWRIIVIAAAFFMVTNLISMCSISLDECKRIILPLETHKEKGKDPLLVKRYVAIAGALSVVLMAGFLIANYAMEKSSGTDEYTRAEGFVRSQIEVAAYVLDGKYYDQQAVEGLIEETRERSQNLSKEAEGVLVPLINGICDEQIENVDSYLDWYYSLPADYDRLIQTFTGVVEDGVKEQFAERINEGVDDSELTSQIENYLEQAAALQSDLMEELSEYELSGVPEWLITTKEDLGYDFLTEPLEPTQKLLSVNTRLGISAEAGVVSGVVAARTAKKVYISYLFSSLWLASASKVTESI